jgi:hypothetical protein
MWGYLKNRFFGVKIKFGTGASVNREGKKKSIITLWTSKMNEHKEDEFKK